MDELRSFLEVIENKDFSRLPAFLRRRTFRIKEASPSRVGDGADLFYNDPIGRRLIDQKTTNRRCREVRRVPPGHPVDYE